MFDRNSLNAMRFLNAQSLLVCCLLIGGVKTHAAGYSEPAVPTRIDIVRSEGFMLFGAFGNPSGCVG